MKSPRGFSLIEILVVIAIIGILASIITVSLLSSLGKARDAKRKVELAQIGRFLTASCYVPESGAGDYDMQELVPELKLKYPQSANLIANLPHDPKSSTDTQTRYRYIVDGLGKCSLYANLENKGEKVTLPSISAPTAGGGTGVWEAASDGWNGSPNYFQVSN